MIKSLTKMDYYRSKNLMIPRKNQRLMPEQPPYTHKLCPLPLMTKQIFKIIESKTKESDKSEQLISCYQIIHNLQQKLAILSKQKNLIQQKNEQFLIGIQNKDRQISNIQKQLSVLRQNSNRHDFQNKMNYEQLRRQMGNIIATLEIKLKESDEALKQLKNKQNCEIQEVSRKNELRIIDKLNEKQNQINHIKISKDNMERQIQKHIIQINNLKDHIKLNEREYLKELSKILFERQKIEKQLIKNEHTILKHQQIHKQEIKILQSKNKEYEQLCGDLKKQIQLINTKYQQKQLFYQNESKEWKQRSNQIIIENKRQFQIYHQDLIHLKKQKSELEKQISRKNKKIEDLEQNIKYQQQRFNEQRIQFENLLLQKDRQYKSQHEANYETLIQNLQQKRNRDIIYQIKKATQKYQQTINEQKNDFIKKQLELKKLIIEKQRQNSSLISNLEEVKNNWNRQKQNLFLLKQQNNQQIQNIILLNSEKIKVIEHNNKRLGDQNTKFQNQTIELKNKITYLQKILSNNQRIKDQTESKRNKLSIQLQNIKSQLNSKTQTIINLQFELKSQINKKNQIIIELKQVKYLLEKKQCEISSLKKDVQNGFNKLRESDANKLQNLRKYKSKQEESQLKFNNLLLQKLNLEKDVKKLENHIEIGECSLKKANIEIERFQNELNNTKMAMILEKQKPIADEHSYKTIQNLKTQYEQLKQNLSNQYRINEHKLIELINQKQIKQRQIIRQINEYETNFSLIRDKLSQKESQIFEKNRAMQLLHIEIQKIKNQAQILKRQKQTSTTLNLKLNHTLKNIQSVNDKNIEQLKSQAEKACFWQTKYNELQQTIRKLEHQGRQKEDKILNLIKNIEFINESTLDNKKSISSTLVDFEKKNSELSQEIVLLNLKISKLESTLQEKQHFCISLKTNNQNQVNFYKEKINQSQRTIKQLQNENIKMSNIMNQLRQQIHSLTNDCQKFIKERNDKIYSLEKQKQTFSQLKIEYLKKIQEHQIKAQYLKREYESKIEQLNRKFGNFEHIKLNLERQNYSKSQQLNQQYLIIQRFEKQQKQLLEQIYSKSKSLAEIEYNSTLRASQAIQEIERKFLYKEEELKKQKKNNRQEINYLKARINQQKNSYSKYLMEEAQKYNILLMKFKNTNKQLIQYKRKWARICGEVHEFSNQLQQIDEIQKKSNYILDEEKHQRDETSETHKNRIFQRHYIDFKQVNRNCLQSRVISSQDDSMNISKYMLTISSQSVDMDHTARNQQFSNQKTEKNVKLT